MTRFPARRTPVRPGRDRDQRGAVVVEFALIVPLLLSLVFGIMEFGYMMNRDTALDNAARDGARTASLGGLYSEICTSISDELKGTGIPVATVNPCNTTQTTNAAIKIDCVEPDGTLCNASTSQTQYDVLVTSGSTATIKVTYNYKWITPLISSLLGNSMTLEQSTQMRVE